MSIYHQGSRALQDQYDTRRLADRIEDVKVHERFTPADREFIARLDMFFLATADANGQPTCSYKGGEVGFVRVIDDQTLAFPNYDGNGMYLSMGNVRLNAQVGMLFIDFERQRRMRVEGVAHIHEADELLPLYPEAQFIVRVSATHVYPNCPRYIHRYVRAEQSAFVPGTCETTPVPNWKRSDWAYDVLPSGDPALDPHRPQR